ncbi:O-antigen polysaccharide polymerase Wzy [Peribacillus sp. SCS-26]|uniref:O-antigen polysaccharide polymerase Wzy n=1 Tax=Paraperibacillus marinus TaxID=3115295 RepID=UPI003905D478
MNISVRKLNILLIGVGVLLSNIIILFNDFFQISEGWEWRCAQVATIHLIYYVLVWRIMKFRWMSPKFFVLLSLIMFHISSVIVIGYDLKFNQITYTTNEMLYRYGEYWGYWGTIYALLFTFVYVIGVICFSNVKKSENNIEYNYNEKNSLYICKKLGIVLFCISVIPELYHDIIQILVKNKVGYEGMFEVEITFQGIPLGWFTKLFLPSILLILSSLRNDKTKFTLIMSLTIIYYLIFMFLSGRKGNTIQTLVPLIFMYCYFFKPKFNLAYALMAYIGSFLITIVTNIRKTTIDGQFMNKLKLVISESEPLKGLALEMGGTVKAVIQSLMAVPSTGSFQYGTSYLASIVYSILSGFKIPTAGIEKFALFNVYLEQPERGAYINSTVYAMGGSAIAEWYWNFGWFGIPLVLIFSLLIVKYENFLISLSQKPIYFAVATSFLYYLMRYTRGYFNEIIWQPIYIMVFVWITYRFLVKRTSTPLLTNLENKH